MLYTFVLLLGIVYVSRVTFTEECGKLRKYEWGLASNRRYSSAARVSL